MLSDNRCDRQKKKEKRDFHSAVICPGFILLNLNVLIFFPFVVPSCTAVLENESINSLQQAKGDCEWLSRKMRRVGSAKVSESETTKNISGNERSASSVPFRSNPFVSPTI
jgi:hypothetical protein